MQFYISPTLKTEKNSIVNNNMMPRMPAMTMIELQEDFNTNKINLNKSSPIHLSHKTP
jgi:hypothetical protein